MAPSPQITERLHDHVRTYNRELGSIALLKALLGAAFSLLIFGFMFIGCWLLGFLFARYTGLPGWLFALLTTTLFFVVATWTAWRRVDPLSGVERLTDEQLMLTLVSQASGSLVYFSPRHATAGTAVVLIGGPANIFQAIGTWNQRIQADEEMIDKAAELLVACQTECTAKKAHASAALMLRQLALIKVLRRDEGPAFTVTDTGLTILNGGLSSRRKPAKVQSSSKAARRKEKGSGN